MGQTIAEKILARTSGKQDARAGEIVDAIPDIVMTHYTTYRAITVLNNLGVGPEKIWDKSRLRIPLDHRSPAKAAAHANQEKMVRDFALENGIKYWELNNGIAHTTMLESHEILPGMFSVGTDSHTTIYGAVGAFGTGIGYTEAAAVWLTGKIWTKVPETIKVTLDGKAFPEGVYPRDFITSVIGDLSADGCNYKSVEFYGSMIDSMDMASRMTLCCLSLEMGAKTAIFPPDAITKEYLKDVDKPYDIVLADKDAVYAQEVSYQVEKLEPAVSMPHTVDNVGPVSSVKNVRVDQAFLGSCANGNFEDMAIAAKILKGKKVAPHVRLLVAPASKNVLQKMIETGVASDLIDSGAMMLNPGCSACTEDGGSLADGEVCISSSTRNFLARMGNAKSFIYLGSPATVAASAIKGEITDPREMLS